MKTIILYATKHGAAAEIAKRIETQIDGSVSYDLKQGDSPSLDEFDFVIIGSAVYAGSFRKEAKSFLVENAESLCKKKLALFISGMSESDGDEAFKSNVPEAVLQAATVKGSLGGIFDPGKSNFFERLVMKVVTKQSGYVSNVSDEKITKFVEAIKM